MGPKTKNDTYCVSYLPLTLHKVSTILSALAGERNALAESSTCPVTDCIVFRAYCATVPTPRPAASEPNDIIRPIREDGTTRAFEFSLSCRMF